ncbi:DUF2306 domain-containing protein [Microbulbifer sp. SAOS-129_SWC]|uniref:DUF2306 domain-containing protein n=1 Tax=Microbulbifer sp. SAOS-129_SWC TaxID=3145235 RepID=UPI003217FDE2
MIYLHLAYWHLATIVPAFFIGTYLLLRRKGTPGHRLLGKLYMLLMLATALITLFMSAQVGPTLFHHFGFIHIFSLLVLYSVPAAYLAVRSGNIKKHRGNMVGLYIGGLLLAGSFALMPGRLLHGWVFA